MAKVKQPQPPGTKLSEDGQRYIHPSGSYTPVYKEVAGAAAGATPAAYESDKAESNPFKKGDKMPSAGMDEESKRNLRLWREAQGGGAAPGSLTAGAQSSALRKKKEEK